MNVYEMSLEKICLTKSNFKEIGFQIFHRNIQIWRCFNIVRQHVPTVAHNCHGKIYCSRQNFNLQSYYQINFNGINTTLFHETNTFSRHKHSSRHKHFFTAQTLSHDTNTFSRHKHFLRFCKQMVYLTFLYKK